MNNLKSKEYFEHCPTSTQYVVVHIATVPRLRWHTIGKTFRIFKTFTCWPDLLRRVSRGANNVHNLLQRQENVILFKCVKFWVRALLAHQNSTTFPWLSMTIFAKIHGLEKLETTKQAEQGLHQTTQVTGTQSLNWSARPSYDKLRLRVS